MIRHYIIEEEGEIVVNRKECYLIPEFNILFQRDKGNKNDLKGKHQLTACGEMKYIYYYYDPRSEFFNTPLNLSEDIVRDLSGLPSNWARDKVFEKAVEKYKRLQSLSSAGSAYFAADSALFDRGQDIKELSDVIRSYKIELRLALKERTKISKEYTLEELEMTTKLTKLVSYITTVQNDIDKLINALPKLANTVKDLRERYSEEEGNNDIVIGGGELGPRES